MASSMDYRPRSREPAECAPSGIPIRRPASWSIGRNPVPAFDATRCPKLPAAAGSLDLLRKVRRSTPLSRDLVAGRRSFRRRVHLDGVAFPRRATALPHPRLPESFPSVAPPSAARTRLSPRRGPGVARPSARASLVQQAPVRRRQEDVPQETIVRVGLLDVFSSDAFPGRGGEMGGASSEKNSSEDGWLARGVDPMRRTGTASSLPHADAQGVAVHDSSTTPFAEDAGRRGVGKEKKKTASAASAPCGTGTSWFPRITKECPLSPYRYLSASGWISTWALAASKGRPRASRSFSAPTPFKTPAFFPPTPRRGTAPGNRHGEGILPSLYTFRETAPCGEGRSPSAGRPPGERSGPLREGANQPVERKEARLPRVRFEFRRVFEPRGPAAAPPARRRLLSRQPPRRPCHAPPTEGDAGISFAVTWNR